MILLIGMPGFSEYAIIGLIVGVFYLRTLQVTLAEISPENRTMSPANVWWLLVPFFGAIWHFVIVNSLADSIRAEAISRNIKTNEEKPGYNIGKSMCISFLLLHLINIVPVFMTTSSTSREGAWAILLLIFGVSIVSLICWISYWKKINRYKNLIMHAKANSNIEKNKTLPLEEVVEKSKLEINQANLTAAKIEEPEIETFEDSEMKQTKKAEERYNKQIRLITIVVLTILVLFVLFRVFEQVMRK